MSNLFATPWVPQLRGNALRPCPPIEALVEDEVKPDSRKEGERPWSLPGFREIVNSVPVARAALQECMLAIWRLRATEEEASKPDGEFAELWQDHFEAWTVRCYLGSAESGRGH